MNKIRIQARINPYNYEMIQLLSDMFHEGGDKENLSASLDFVLTKFRNDNSGFIEILSGCKSYKNGSRSKKDINAMKWLEAFLLTNTEKYQEELLNT